MHFSLQFKIEFFKTLLAGGHNFLFCMLIQGYD